MVEPLVEPVPPRMLTQVVKSLSVKILWLPTVAKPLVQSNPLLVLQQVEPLLPLPMERMAKQQLRQPRLVLGSQRLVSVVSLRALHHSLELPLSVFESNWFFALRSATNIDCRPYLSPKIAK